jgi:NAD(P)-dependent dehydrogenase (short-subunit alcohol dehydrogenase family)
VARRTRPGRWDAVPRQDGRRFVVTGASGGLGLATASRLAQAGAEVVLAVRNLDKGRSAAAAMRGRVEVQRLDVADQASVREFADRVGPVDVLVNNAGVLAVPWALTADGFETHLATNHLGHFALTNLLLPRLTDRVVVVSSDSHHTGELDLTDLSWERREYRPFAAYGATKIANLLFMAELQRRLTAAGSTLRATAAHPGSTSTGITGSTGNRVKTWVGSWGHRLVGMPAWKGALTTLYAATMDVPGNTFIGPGGFKEMTGWPTSVGRSSTATDPDLAKELWTRSEELTGTSFPF